MDVIGLLVNAVSGGVGGLASGAALKDKSLGTIGNTIAGVVGGTAGTYILQAVGILSSMGLSEITVGSILSGAATSAICGAVVTAVAGFAKKAMNKS